MPPSDPAPLCCDPIGGGGFLRGAEIVSGIPHRPPLALNFTSREDPHLMGPSLEADSSD